MKWHAFLAPKNYDWTTIEAYSPKMLTQTAISTNTISQNKPSLTLEKLDFFWVLTLINCSLIRVGWSRRTSSNSKTLNTEGSSWGKRILYSDWKSGDKIMRPRALNKVPYNRRSNTTVLHRNRSSFDPIPLLTFLSNSIYYRCNREPKPFSRDSRNKS